MTSDFGCSELVVSSGGIPQWMVYFRENPSINWMMTGGSRILGNHQLSSGQNPCWLMIVRIVLPPYQAV